MTFRGCLTVARSVWNIRLELGLTRAAAEAIMRQLPKCQVPGLRKTYVRRDDLLRVVGEWTRYE